MNKIDSLDVCGKAVNAILDQSKGFNIKAPMLFSLALEWIYNNYDTFGPSDYTRLYEKVDSHIRDHKDLYIITKGRHGGIQRLSDMTVPANTHCACKFCKTDLLVSEKYCWKCGTKN